MIAVRPTSSEALLSFGEDLSIQSWNSALEELTGIPGWDAVGRPCWEVLDAVAENGEQVCHPGCPGARLAREGWDVPCRRVLIRTAAGRRRVTMSTVALTSEGEDAILIHMFRDEAPPESPNGLVTLTGRQLQILRLLADGTPVKGVALTLGIAPVTVRNHIRAILARLRCHSQLAAVAEGRRQGLI
ncbi:MAG: LuxR C-terminal-related transcriptional regulator [Actinomycetota bacterium]